MGKAGKGWERLGKGPGERIRPFFFYTILYVVLPVLKQAQLCAGARRRFRDSSGSPRPKGGGNVEGGLKM